MSERPAPMLSALLLLLAVCTQCVGMLPICEDVAQDAEDDVEMCEAGAVGPCAMPDGTNGVRHCVDGKWEECTTVHYCTPGHAAQCTTQCGGVGTQTCRVDFKWSECVPPEETCNGVDDDCDGKVDEDDAGSPLERPCYCAEQLGEEVCFVGTWSPCSTGTATGVEVCDGKDNDCDGLVDEDLGSTECGLGVCNHTVPNCVGGAPQGCDPMAGATDEICDQQDNNCNGEVDEGIAICCVPGSLLECGTDVGECELGTRTCGEGRTWGPCSGVLPEPEVCDGKDNDCNGETDDGDPEGGQTCGSDLGECEPGLTECSEGELECIGLTGPVEEICDGKDNDCSGFADDGLAVDQYESNDQCPLAWALGDLEEDAVPLLLSATLYEPDGAADSDWFSVITKEEPIGWPCGLLFPPEDGCYSLEIELEYPAEVHYDLVVYAEECESVEQFEGAGLDNAKWLALGWEGQPWGPMAGRSFFIQVAATEGSGQSCQEYALTVQFLNLGCKVDGMCPWEEGYEPP